MLRTEEELDNSTSEMSEKSFDNLHDIAESPQAHSPLFDSKKLEQMEWELSMDRTRLQNCGRLFFFLNCIFCIKYLVMLPLEIIHCGGWYFLIPLTMCTLVLGLPMAFLEVALGQFTSQLATVIFSRIAPVAVGVGLMFPCLRFLLFIYYRTEHRNVALIWDMIQKIFFTGRNIVCWRQNMTDCYIPGVCQEGWVFYQGGCYNREILWKDKQISSQMMVKLHAMELLQQSDFYEDPFIQPIPHVDRIFNLDSNAHKLDSIITFFIVVFLFSKLGVLRVSKVRTKICSPKFRLQLMSWFHITIGLLIIIVLIFLLPIEPIRNACMLFFDVVTFSSSPKILYSVEIWQTAATDALTLLAVGDGTLHALGAINIFNNNIFWDLIVAACSWFAIVGFSIFFFGTVIIAGINAEQREMVQDVFTDTHIDKLVDKIRIYPYKQSSMHPFYYFSWIDHNTQYCSCVLFVILFLVQIAPHVLMAENVVAVMMRLCNQLSQLNKTLVRHCVTFLYYAVMALWYWFLVNINQGDKEHIGMCYRNIVLAIVFWECLVIHRLYGIQRILVNIRTMFDKSPHAFRNVKRFSQVFFHLWSWFIPLITGLLFITSIFHLLREIHITVLMLVIICISFLPIFFGSWVIVKECLKKGQVQAIFRPTIDWGPFGINDKKNANFDEKAARLTFM